MKRALVFLFLNFSVLYLFSQKKVNPPLPPNPKKKISNSKPIKIIEVIEAELPVEELKINYPNKEITEKVNFEYYSYIDNKIKSLDTSITLNDILNKKYYLFNENKVNPNVLDSLAIKGYKLNEKKNYIEAITVLKELLELSPLSISAYKELGYAYEKLENQQDANRYFSYMIKIADAISKVEFYGINISLNHKFEGVSFMETKYNCYPDKEYNFLSNNGEICLVYECLHKKIKLNIKNYEKYK